MDWGGQGAMGLGLGPEGNDSGKPEDRGFKRLGKRIFLTNAVVLRQPEAGRPRGGSNCSKMRCFQIRMKIV